MRRRSQISEAYTCIFAVVVFRRYQGEKAIECFGMAFQSFLSMCESVKGSVGTQFIDLKTVRTFLRHSLWWECGNVREQCCEQLSYHVSCYVRYPRQTSTWVRAMVNSRRSLRGSKRFRVGEAILANPWHPFELAAFVVTSCKTRILPLGSAM